MSAKDKVNTFISDQQQSTKHTLIFAASVTCIYNLPTEKESYIGVYASNSTQWLGLFYLKDTHELSQLTIESAPEDDPNYKIFELKKYCKLLVNGNPTAIELLFIDSSFNMDDKKDCYWHHYFDELREQRNKMITRYSISKHIGQAKAYLPKTKYKGIDYKKYEIVHVFRLLFDGQRLLNGNKPIVTTQDGSERDFLINILNDRISSVQIIDKITEITDSLENKRMNFEPLNIDSLFIKEWLSKIRRNNLKEEISNVQ